MTYLVDTNVLSELARPAPEPRVVEWLRANEADLAISPVVLGEIEVGILLMPPGRRRRQLERWYAHGIRPMRIVDIDGAVAAAWARMTAKLRRAGLAIPMMDGLVAATALAHGLTVATRNTADFRHAEVDLVNPFSA